MTDGGIGPALRIEAPAAVRQVRLSDSARRVTALLADLRVASWSCADAKPLSEASYHGPPPLAGAVNAAGDRIAVATAEGGVQLRDTSSLALIAEMSPPRSPRGEVAFSPDGKLLAGFARGRHLDLAVWNVASGKLSATFADDAQEPAGIAFHPAGRLAAVSVLCADVLLLDLGSPRVTRTFSDAAMACEALAFTGDTLVGASYEGALLAWDTARGGVRRLPGLQGVNALAVSSDSHRVAVSRSSYNPSDTPAEARLVDLRSGQTLTARTLGIASTTDAGFTAGGGARVASARGTVITVHELG
jgi:WD40 repeat protein